MLSMNILPRRSLQSSPVSVAVLVLTAVSLFGPRELFAQAEFVRGDVNADGHVSIVDATAWGCLLFCGSFPLSCGDAADVDDNGRIDISDLVITLIFIFSEHDADVTIAAPFPTPGLDPTEDSMDCESHDVTPPIVADDKLSLGHLQGAPGELVKVPLRLTTTVRTEAVQVAVRFDPTLFTPIDFEALDRDEVDELTKRGTVLDRGGQFATLGFLGNRVVEEEGVLWIGYVYGILQNETVGPGEDLHVLNIPGYVSPTARAGEVITLEFVELPQSGGITMRSEVNDGWTTRIVRDFESGSITVAEAFVRGDGNVDGGIDISDSIHVLQGLFTGGAVIDCLDSADFNDDSAVDISDAVSILNYLFLGGIHPSAPFAECGADPSDDSLDCVSYPPCR